MTHLDATAVVAIKGHLRKLRREAARLDRQIAGADAAAPRVALLRHRRDQVEREIQELTHQALAASW